MKSAIIFVIPVIFFLGCTSTASRSRESVSRGAEIDEIEKAEISDVPSPRALEAIAEAPDVTPASTTTVNDGAEAAQATTPAPSTPAATTPPPSTTASTSSSAASSDDSSAASSSSATAASEGETASETAEDDEEEPQLSSEEILSATKAPIRRAVSIAKAVSNALSNVGIVPRSSTSATSDAEAAPSDAPSGASDSGETESAESAESSPASSAAATPRAPATTAEVLRAVGGLRGLSGWTIIPFAHFRRGARHAVVVWPAINSAGRLVDATVVGICLDETDAGELEECGRRWVVRDGATSRAATVDALGGTDYQVMGRSAGVSLDELGPRLASLGSEFSQAVASGNSARARQAAMAATQLLPVNNIAYENGLARLLYAASAYNGRLEHVSTERNGDSASLVFHVRRGVLRLQTLTATASPVSQGSDRWIITSYR